MKIGQLDNMSWKNPVVDFLRRKSVLEKYYTQDCECAERQAIAYLKTRKENQPLSEYGEAVAEGIVHALRSTSILNKKTRESFFLSRRLKRLKFYYSLVTGETWQQFRV